VVIVGYTEPRRSRKYFGSLVLAVRDKAKKRWVYAGHVGTGFDHVALKSIYGAIQPLHAGKKPFDQKVRYENETTWLIPKLVGEVKFTEWTSDGEMRHRPFLDYAPTKRRSTSSANMREKSISKKSAPVHRRSLGGLTAACRPCRQSPGSHPDLFHAATARPKVAVGLTLGGREQQSSPARHADERAFEGELED
jgi:hypothetical protein